MKNFDARWQHLANQSRSAKRPDEQAPFGFAARITARAFARTPGKPSALPVWERLLARFLTGATAALVICAAMEWRYFRDRQPLDPGIENAVAELVWTL